MGEAVADQAIQKLAQDITKGSISGVVHDATGAVVQGATVKLKSPNGDRSTTSDSVGGYTFANLAAVYRNFDWDGPLDFVKKAAGLSTEPDGPDVVARRIMNPPVRE